MTIEYRPLTPADKPAVMRLLQNTPEFTPEELPVAEEVLDDCLLHPADSGYHGIAAVRDGALCGYILYGNTPLTRGNWEIYWLAVGLSARNLGIGGRLVQLAESEIRQRGGRQITLETSSQPSYQNTRRFYRTCGFHETACIPDFYDRGDDLLIYLKKLA
jgi:ribosomal protein S18 acetylase RimI-like enzyme